MVTTAQGHAAEPENISWEQRKRKLLPYAYLSPTLLCLRL